MKLRSLIHLIVLICIISIIFSISFIYARPTIDLDSSYFDDFYIESGYVHMKCRIKITNRSGKDFEFKLIADSYEDAQSGLLADPKMIGYDIETQIPNLTIKAFSSKTYNIDFIGKHLNANIKQDRLLPNKIQILVIDW